MNPKEFARYLQSHPQHHRTFAQRPHWNRRQFLEIAGGLTASTLVGRLPGQEVVGGVRVETKNTAKNVIFILLAGAPSHLDMFDFKPTPSTPMDRMKPETIRGVVFPTGAMPKLATQLGDLAIVRSMRAWALQHSLGQMWVQIGRSPAAVLGDIAPNIGTIVAIEKEPERKPSQVFPAFLALNSGQAVGSGYLAAKYGPFKTNPSARGLSNTSNPDGQMRFDQKWTLLRALDDNLRIDSPVAKELSDYDDFFKQARALSYNDIVNQAFQFTTADSQRYGASAFGDACLVSRQVLAANQGTRFIQITLGGWDMHTDIYGTGPNAQRGNIFWLTKQLDDGLSALLTDLKSSGLLNETLVVMMGEFGRTVGSVTGQGGRDHFLQQFCVLAGGGIKGGRVLGATNAQGSETIDFGWAEQRDVRAEDIEATIYSALGINWTYTRMDDPFNRGFEYVPGAKDGVYRPLHELWG